MAVKASASITLVKVSDGTSYWRSQQTIDLSNTTIYDVNKWYPVTGTQLLTTAYNRILVYVALNSGTKPPWSTHAGGFSVNFDIASLGSGWGTTTAETIIYGDTYSYCSVSPASYTQLTNSSTPVLYLRGGGKYYVKTDYVCSWTPRSTDFVHTVTSNGNTYTQTAPVLSSRPTPVGRNIKGPQGIQGPKGTDGKTYYTWLKYADSPTSGMSDSPTGKAYIGLAYNKSTATESSTYSDYTWSKIKGETGNTGVQGPKGADGKTYYTWIKYATSASGANMSDSPTGRTYIGIAYNKTTATESTTASDYTWSLIKGDKGDKGDDGTVHSDTEPADKTKLWLDTSLEPPLLKWWDGSTWIITNDYSNEIDITKQTITTEYTEAINQAKGALELLVSKLTETVSSNHDSMIEITNAIKIAPETIDLIKTTSEKVKDLQTGKVSIQDIQEWARFNGATLELGASDSKFKAMLTNSELAFYQDGTKVAWVSNNELHQLKAMIEKSLTIDIWQWESIKGVGLVLRRLKR